MRLRRHIKSQKHKRAWKDCRTDWQDIEQIGDQITNWGLFLQDVSHRQYIIERIYDIRVNFKAERFNTFMSMLNHGL